MRLLPLVTFLVLVHASVAPSAAQTDRLDTDQTPWLWLVGQTGTQVLERIGLGWKLIDVEFRTNAGDAADPFYDVLFVANDEAQTSTFLVTPNPGDLITFANNNSLRPIDLELYLVPGTSSFLYAAAYEPAVGTGWTILIGLPTAQAVVDYASANNARPIDIEVTETPVGVHALFYENVGDDLRSYAIFLGVTAQQWLDAAFNNNLRPVDIDVRGPDLFDIVYVDWSEAWSWWNQSASGVVLAGLASLDLRAADIEWSPFSNGWTVIGLQNWLFKNGFESGNTNAWQ